MPLPDEARERFLRGPISVAEIFDGLDPSLRRDFALIEKHRFIPHATDVLESRDRPQKIYVHSKGEIGLTDMDGAKHAIVYCPAAPDRIYGLVEALTDTEFVLGIRTITGCEFDVIERNELINFIHERPAVSFRLAAILSHLYQQALTSIRAQ